MKGSKNLWLHFIRATDLRSLTYTCIIATGFNHCYWLGSVGNSRLALGWMCDSLQTGCVRRITPIYMWRKQAITEWTQSVDDLLLLRWWYFVAIGKHQRQVHQASHHGSMQQQRSHATITLRVCYSLCSIIHMLVLAKITHHDQFITASLHHIYMGVILHAH